jgi:hypothetical protein
MIRNESYDEDAKKVLNKLGVQYEDKLPRLNPTDWDRANFMSYYDKTTEQKARQFFKDDFLHLGY